MAVTSQRHGHDQVTPHSKYHEQSSKVGDMKTSTDEHWPNFVFFIIWDKIHLCCYMIRTTRHPFTAPTRLAPIINTHTPDPPVDHITQQHRLFIIYMYIRKHWTSRMKLYCSYMQFLLLSSQFVTKNNRDKWDWLDDMDILKCSPWCHPVPVIIAENLVAGGSE